MSIKFHNGQVAGHILELAGARRFKANIVLEGGSIHVDGEGCVTVSLTCGAFQPMTVLKPAPEFSRSVQLLRNVKNPISYFS